VDYNAKSSIHRAQPPCRDPPLFSALLLKADMPPFPSRGGRAISGSKAEQAVGSRAHEAIAKARAFRTLAGFGKFSYLTEPCKITPNDTALCDALCAGPSNPLEVRHRQARKSSQPDNFAIILTQDALACWTPILFRACHTKGTGLHRVILASRAFRVACKPRSLDQTQANEARPKCHLANWPTHDRQYVK
jgi:hypothetical protein